VIRDRGVAGRYAQALFAAAVKAGEAEIVLEDYRSLEEVYRRDPALGEFLEAPDVLTADKVRLVHSLLDGRAAELLVRFLLLMLQKKRIQHFPLAFAHYRTLVEEHLGMLAAQVVTAVPLPREQAEALRLKLEKLSGKKIRLEETVEPAIVGGIIVRLGEQTCDASIRHRLGELRDLLLATPVR
jgi:F-type H+-transporting ATPase subunit delta